MTVSELIRTKRAVRQFTFSTFLGQDHSCLRRKRGDMQQVDQRERAPKREEDPAHARHMIAQTARLPGARMEIAKSETIIEDEVREDGDFRAHNESNSIGYETVSDLQ